jgi:hypothetical protein
MQGGGCEIGRISDSKLPKNILTTFPHGCYKFTNRKLRSDEQRHRRFRSCQENRMRHILEDKIYGAGQGAFGGKQVNHHHHPGRSWRIDDDRPKLAARTACGIEAKAIPRKPLPDMAIESVEHKPEASITHRRPQITARLTHEYNFNWKDFEEGIWNRPPASLRSYSATRSIRHASRP